MNYSSYTAFNCSLFPLLFLGYRLAKGWILFTIMFPFAFSVENITRVFKVSNTWVWILTQSLSSCVINISLSFLICKMEFIIATFLRLLWRINEITYIALITFTVYGIHFVIVNHSICISWVFKELCFLLFKILFFTRSLGFVLKCSFSFYLTLFSS